MKKGDTMNPYFNSQSKEDLVLKYLPLVRKVVGGFSLNYNGEMEEDDLLSIGVIGLMDAIKKYDSSKKVPFEAYASLRIRGAIIDELRKNGKVSRHSMDKLNRYYEVKNKLVEKLSREPKDIEIMDKMDISSRELNSIYETMNNLANISLDYAIFGDGDSEGTLLDVLVDDKSIGPEEYLLRDEKVISLTKAIDTLSEKEKILLNLYYYEELTLKEIGHILDVSVSRVSQIHGKVLIKLSSLLK